MLVADVQVICAQGSLLFAAERLTRLTGLGDDVDPLAEDLDR